MGLALFLCHLTLSGQVNQAWEQWISKNSYELSLNDTVNYDDLTCV